MSVRPRKAVQSGDDGSEDEESQRCPICLNFPKSSECAVPDVCNHIYCLSCILRWSQTLQICPVDRRPFRSIFKQDPVLGCIKIPVQTSSISWSCEDGKTAESFSKEEKTKVEENGDKRASATLKCKICETDSSALKKKKVKAQTCRSQLLTHHVPRGLSAEQGKTLGMLNQVITETVVITEEETIDKDWRACRRNMIDHQWLPVSIPSPSTYMPSILSRQCVRTQALFLQPVPSTSPCSLVSGFPALFGKVCAVMCPKGEGRKGTRGSGSKGPSKQAESLKTTRSTRSRKSTSVSEEPLPQQSGSSSPAGSDSNEMAASTSKQRLTGKQKPTAKRKGRTKKAANRRAVVESEEEGDDKRDENELSDEKSKDDPEVNVEEVQEAETSEETQANQSFCPGDVSADVDLGSDSEVHDGEDQQMDVNDLQNIEESEQSSPLTGEHNEEESESEVEPNDNQTSPQEDHVEEEEPEGQPAVSPERDLQPSVSSADQVTIEECSESSSSIMSPPQEDLSTATESLLEKETDPKPEPDPKLETDPKPEPEVQPELLNCGSVTEDICKSSILDSIPPAITVEDCLPKDQEPLAAAERMQEESVDISNHQDNIEAIPMDCDSPGSDNNSHVGEIILENNNNAVPGSQIASPDPTPSQESQQQNQVTEHKTETSEEPKSTGRADGRQRKSRFHSPTTTWSPKSESRREGSRRSRSRDRSRNASSPHRSRGSEREEDQGSSRWNRSRERWSRRRSRSRSRNRSRSRSRSRNRSYRRSLSSERNDHGAHSPRRRESRGGEGWRGAHSSRSSNWRNNSERQGQFPSRDSGFSTNGSLCPPETSPDRGQTENPHWVNERSRLIADGREREQHFEDKSGDAADSWSRRGRGFEQGRGAGRGRGGMCPPGQYGESAGNWRQQQRNSFSGTTNNTGSDSYSHFNENRNGGKRKELEINESPLDRSGWSAASSWAVRRTLPADVQNYYSRRDRGPGPGGSIWNRPEEEQPAAGVSRQTDLPQSEPNTHIPNEAVPAPPSVLPPQLNMLGVLRHPLGPMGPPGPPMSIHPVPFTIPTPIPVHLHPPPPPIQVPAMGMQALPPPPPPPPPVQQGSLTILPADTHPQMIASVPVLGKAQVRASPSKATPSQSLSTSTPSVAQPSSTTQPSSHSKAHADSSKKEKKLHIQEKAIAEVKAAIKPYYQKKDITKEEYKEIVRKAVEKVCHSKSGEVNASKVANLVKAYVDKYKHVRKNKTDKN